jgi:hypothetical protein
MLTFTPLSPICSFHLNDTKPLPHFNKFDSS